MTTNQDPLSISSKDTPEHQPGSETIREQNCFSDSTSTTSDQSTSHLLALPAKLREHIFTYATYTQYFTISQAVGIEEPALLMTCKQIRHEAIRPYYTNNIVVIDSINFDVASEKLLYHKIAILATRYKVDFKAKGSVYLRDRGPPNWKNWKHRLQRYHKTFSGIHDFPNPRRPPDPVIRAAMVRVGHRSPLDPVIRAAMARMVYEMSDTPWAEVERILELLKAGLVVVDARWADD